MGVWGFNIFGLVLVWYFFFLFKISFGIVRSDGDGGVDKISLKCRKSFNNWIVPIWIYNTFKVLENVIFDSKNILQRHMHCMNKSMCVWVCVFKCLVLGRLHIYLHKESRITLKPGKIQMEPFSFFKPTLSGKNPSRFWPLSPAPMTTTLKLSSPASKAGIRKNSGSCPGSTRGSSQTTTR